ncbi:MAG: hypothetical protein N0C88_15500 [Candidatus Thiodiazotropha lotti]|uniref:Uncharacterized protein n=1 Tax=Candidatus Thiodiazotropha lotti TaxID=2792787 RepID=A0A9E4K8C8_9GAMM|nr:hypothetical protein [Candidatus Thiodiazotropha lotti]MCG7988847.1 hypothetical protein [Candidatus Thiodiazotropha lotti]MCG8021909.1 hypothetical protein [Candidatus Thiodiazotropha lotti]MCW4204702.1 hypothetical protein [Candidatus Thiodiazotropha lotti]MCW4209081.1 hypothetical protein [Candidatus Thiodiazotropha lotti]
MDPYTKLIDYFLKLMEIRNQRKDKYYQEVVKECYSNAKYVRDDLIRIFKETESDIKEGKSLDDVAYRVMNDRVLELSKRDILRTALDAAKVKKFTAFEEGIQMLLDGNFNHAIKNNVRDLMYCHKEILDSYRLNKHGHNKRREELIRKALDMNKESIDAVDSAWVKINQGYGNYLREYIST